MTRINSAINPKNLTDQHLIAELRELPRVFTLVDNRLRDSKNFNDKIGEFTLGSGHVKFFYDKLSFLFDRFRFLKIEYSSRFKKDWQYDIDIYYLQRWIYCDLYNSYEPTEKERKLLIERISTRINESNQIPRYYGEKITKEKAIQILNIKS